MELTAEDVTSFIDVWEKAFGERLTRAQAESDAKRLIDFFLTLAAERLDRTGQDSSGSGTMA